MVNLSTFPIKKIRGNFTSLTYICYCSPFKRKNKKQFPRDKPRE